MTTPPTGDEIAGVVDLFGALSRAELRRALREAAFRAGREFDPAAAGTATDSALASYRLVAVEAAVAGVDPSTLRGGDDPDAGSGDSGGDDPAENEGTRLLVVGPTAFPTLPEGGEDLPHILDVERRDVDRAAAGEAALSQFREEATRAVDADDAGRIRRLLDVSYDLEAWAPVELGDLRDRLDDALDGGDRTEVGG